MKTNILNNLGRNFHKFGFKVKKHSPEILAVAGAVGVVASTVIACKATTKLSVILDESKEQVDKIHACMNDDKLSDRYSEEDSKKDLLIVYSQTGAKLIKLYAPAVALGALSLTCMLTSNSILRKRNVALAAAYATVDKGFKQYRGRVIERFGDTVDRELKYNIKAEEIEETTADENGKETTVKKPIKVINREDVSDFAALFGQYAVDKNGKRFLNSCWQPSDEYNLIFLKQQERYANDKLKSKGYLFLNEVYQMIGLPETKAGQIVGWIYCEDGANPMGDNFVDFGLHNGDLIHANDTVGDYKYPAILLDFNVDGSIWEYM